MKDVETMGIMGLRKTLGQRIDAAFFHNEPTVIKNEKKNEPRAALIPHKWLVELYELRKFKAQVLAERASKPSD